MDSSAIASRMPTLANLINPRPSQPSSSTPQSTTTSQPQPPASTNPSHIPAQAVAKVLTLSQSHQNHSQNHPGSWTQSSPAPQPSLSSVPPSIGPQNMHTQTLPPNPQVLGHSSDYPPHHYLPFHNHTPHSTGNFQSSSSISSQQSRHNHLTLPHHHHSHQPPKLLPPFEPHSQNRPPAPVGPHTDSQMPPHATHYGYPLRSEERGMTPPLSTVAEFGRTYPISILGRGLYPCDEKEQERLDIYHMVFKVALNQALHQAPLPSKPKILDVGCGTGIWALEMGEQYKDANIVGIDIIDVQPKSINHPNVKFYSALDMEDPSSYLRTHWDLIHLRMAGGHVKDWRRLYTTMFSYLTPGDGWLEHVEIDLKPRCNDQTLSPDSDLVAWYNYLCSASIRGGCSLEYPTNTREILEDVGFTDIQEKVIRAPLNGWPADPRESGVGRWYNLGLVQGGGVESLSLAPFCRLFNWDENADVRPFLNRVESEMAQSRIHGYHNIHVWTARRPVQ